MAITKTNDKKDGIWKYRVRVAYMDVNGKHRQKERKVYGLAAAKLAEEQLRYEIAHQGDNTDIKVKELYARYIAAQKNEVRETTLDKAMQKLTAHVLPYVGEAKLSKLSAHMLQEWKNTINEKSLKVQTKQNIYSSFNAMLNFAVRMQYIQNNPLKLLGNFQDVNFESDAKIRYYTPEQIRRYFDVARSSCSTLFDRCFYVFFAVAVYTGMRKGEINALKWSDIEGNIIHVRRSISQKLKGARRETPPKNKSSVRDLQMPQELMSILRVHHAEQRLSGSYSDDFRVCGGADTLSDTSIDNFNRSVVALAGDLPRLTIHEFRHTHASLLCNEGINIQEIARRLGHSNVQTTWKIYAHLYPREEERAVAVLDRLALK